MTAGTDSVTYKIHYVTISEQRLTSYEATFVFLPDAESVERGKQAVQDAFIKAGAKITGEDDIGERGLAYPIRKQERGYYLLYEIDCDPQRVQGLYQAAGLVPDILKCFIVHRVPEVAPAAPPTG